MRLLSVLLLLLLAGQSWAGTLSDFEKDATKQESSEKSRRHRPEPEPSDEEPSNIFGEIIGEAIVKPISLAIVYGGSASWQRAVGAHQQPRRDGDPLLPKFRIDSSYQIVADDVQALDLRGEAGFGPIALQVRHTRYWEQHPADRLSTTQVHLLYRMSPTPSFEWDLGLGALILDGRGSNSGASFTSPLVLHPWRYLGLELRPAWSAINGNAIQDYDLAMLIGPRHASFKLGYRWFVSEHTSLNGPQAGLAVYW
jgi:hypothetical protein